MSLMDIDSDDELRETFSSASPAGLNEDVLTELRSISRLHSFSAQELFYKWESFCVKMGPDGMALTLENVRAFKNDIQEALERDSRAKHHMRNADKRASASTPRHVSGHNSDIFGMLLDDIAPATPGAAVKRKLLSETASASKLAKPSNSSPIGMKTPQRNVAKDASLVSTTPFSERKSRGHHIETIHRHLHMPSAPMAPHPEPRVKPTANTDLKKFAYRPMAMHLSSSSEVLDDRIDEFLEVFQKHHQLDDTSFGSAAHKSTKEVVAVGRIACDSLEGKLNLASLVLESSRRTGGGLRIPLNVEQLAHVQFFPGQIVALRGINASGEYFTVKEVLSVPLLPSAASSPATLDAMNEKMGGENTTQPLTFMIGSGPYTADDNLDYEPLEELCNKAADDCVDALILNGPFLDLEHPLLASGDFDLPEAKGLDPNTATLSTVFRCLLSTHISRLAQAVPSITIILIPSVRDFTSKHVSWPQEMMSKKELGLPRQARMVSNPITLSLNEAIFGISSTDILYELRTEEATGGKPAEPKPFVRLARYLIEQRHFSPLFPSSTRNSLPRPGIENGLATGAMFDVNYLKLGDWWNVRPDVLIVPSVLPAFVTIIDSVLVINPGQMSKRKAPGSYAKMALHPRNMTEEERKAEKLEHNVYDRARVDIVKI